MRTKPTMRRHRLWQQGPGGYLPVQVLESKGRLLFQLGRFEPTLELYRRIVEWLRPQGGTPLLGGFLCMLSGSLYHIGRYDECGPLLDEAERAYTAAGDRSGLGKVLGHRGNIAMDRRRLDEAMALFQAKLDIARQAGDAPGQINTLGNLGGAYFHLGQHGRAMECLQEMLRLALAHDQQLDVCIALGNLSLLYAEAGDTAAALDHCRRQLDLATKLGDKVGVAYAHDNLGQIRLENGDPEQALSDFTVQLRLAEELGDRFLVHTASINTGRALTALGRTAEARQPLERASSIAAELGLPLGGMQTVLLAEARLAAGDAAAVNEALATIDREYAAQLDEEYRERVGRLRTRLGKATQ